MPDVNIPTQPDTSNLPLMSPAQVSRLALLLSGNKAAMADAGVTAPPDQGTNPATVAMPTSPLAYKAPAMAAPQPAASSVMPTMASPPAAPEMVAQPSAPAAPANAAGLSAMSYRPMPTAPVAPTTDMAARQALVAKQQQYAKPTDPNDPAAKTHWYDRLLGAAVGFGRGYVHDPNAVAEGGAVTNRNYNTAEAMRGKNLDAANTALGEFDQNTSQQDKDYQRQRDFFSDQMRAAQEDRAQKSGAALDAERTAKAGRQDYLSMSPKERADQVSDLEKTSGLTFTDAQKQDFILTGKIPSSANKTPSDKPKTVQEGLFSDDPAVRKQAEKWFSYEGRDKAGDRETKPKTGTPGQFESVEKQKQDALQLLENGDDAKGLVGYKQQLKKYQNATDKSGNPLSQAAKDELIKGLNAEHEDKKAEVQRQYEEKVRSLGGGTGAAGKPSGSEERVPVISKDGKKGTVPKSQLQKALANGYKQAKQ